MCILIGGSLIRRKKAIKSIFAILSRSLVVKQHSNFGKDTIEVGECLTYLANSEKCLK
jgi:hypothetical protein